MHPKEIQYEYGIFHLSGIILEGANPGQERAFRKGVQAANQKLSELRFGQSPQITLHPVLKHIEAGNAYAAAAAG